MNEYYAIQIVNHKEHTVPHYQWLVVFGDKNEKSSTYVCSLNECMMRDQAANQCKAQRIAALLNAAMDLSDEVVFSTPQGMIKEWFDCWLEQTGGDGMKPSTPAPTCNHCGKEQHDCDCDPVCRKP